MDYRLEATFHQPTNVGIFSSPVGGFLVLPGGWDERCFAVFFRGGTGKFGELEVGYLSKDIATFARRTGLAVVCPEYGPNDQHGGEADLRACTDAILFFQKKFPGASYAGSWGVSRGCTQAWLAVDRLSRIVPAGFTGPLALWCPVFDYPKWCDERPDIREMFARMGLLDEASLAARSASTHTEILAAAPFAGSLVLGATRDERSNVWHHRAFAQAPGFAYEELDAPHCFLGERREQALSLTVEVFRKG